MGFYKWFKNCLKIKILAIFNEPFVYIAFCHFNTCVVNIDDWKQCSLYSSSNLYLEYNVNKSLTNINKPFNEFFEILFHRNEVFDTIMSKFLAAIVAFINTK